MPAAAAPAGAMPVVAHASVTSFAAGTRPSSSSCRRRASSSRAFARARESRERTVPTGTPSADAPPPRTSSPCQAQSTKTSRSSRPQAGERREGASHRALVVDPRGRLVAEVWLGLRARGARARAGDAARQRRRLRSTLVATPRSHGSALSRGEPHVAPASPRLQEDDRGQVLRGRPVGRARGSRRGARRAGGARRARRTPPRRRATRRPRGPRPSARAHPQVSAAAGGFPPTWRRAEDGR